MGKQRAKQSKTSKKLPQPPQVESKSAEITRDFASPDSFLSPSVDPNIQRRAILDYGRTHGNQRVLQLLTENPQARNIVARETPVATDGTMAEIRKINNYSWIAPWDEARLQKLWNNYGSYLPEVAAANWDEFQKSQAGGAELEDIAAVKSTRGKFEEDVKGLANQYMAENEKLVLEEMTKIGASPTMCQGMTPEMEQEMAELQTVAQQVTALQEAQQQLRQLHVGYYEHTYDDPFEGETTYTGPMPFNPDRRPDKLPNGDESPAFAPYDAVNESYQSIQGGIRAFADANPALFAVLQSGDVSSLATETKFANAQAIVAKSLGSIYENIKATQPKIDNGDLDWRDLKPLHAQLYKGTKGPSKTDWTNKFSQWAGKEVVAGHESSEFWLSLGLGSLAAAAFLIATFASGGWFALAMGVGVGSGLVQAGMSWEKYFDFAQAAETNLNERTELISDGQVNAALFSAILDSAFTLLDIYAPVKMGVTALRGGKLVAEAGKAGFKKASLEGLKNVASMGDAAAKPLIQKSIVEQGVGETVKKTGKKAEELADIVGRETPEGERLLAYAAKSADPAAGAVTTLFKLRNLGKYIAGEGSYAASKLTHQEANDLVLHAIEVYGPKRVLQMSGGWKKLASTLGDGTSAGDALEVWRSAMFKDLEEYVTKELGGELKRTGSKGNFSNDMDISFLGPNASANREKALSYLAARAGSRPNWVGKLLYCDLFTDPRRIHIYDMLDAGIRSRVATKAAAMEKEIIYARRIYNAQKKGDQEMVELITKQRDALGVKQVSYQTFANTDVGILYKEMDDLHNLLKNATTPELQEELALEIAQKQVLINTAEEGGYFTGGGVRRMVSEPEQFPGYRPEDAVTPFLDVQNLGTALDQLVKLDEVVMGLSKFAKGGTPDVAKLAATLKSIGKYGERFTKELPAEIRKTLTGPVGNPTAFDTYSDAFKELHASARRKATDPTSLIQQIDRDSAKLIGEVQATLRQFEQEQFAIIQALQQAAKQEGVTGNLAKIQQLSIMHTRWVRFKDDYVSHLRQAARMLRNSVRGVNGSDDEAADELNYTPLE